MFKWKSASFLAKEKFQKVVKSRSAEILEDDYKQNR